MTYSCSGPVVTTTSIILCFSKHWLTQVHLEMVVKMEREWGRGRGKESEHFLNGTNNT